MCGDRAAPADLAWGQPSIFALSIYSPYPALSRRLCISANHKRSEILQSEFFCLLWLCDLSNLRRFARFSVPSPHKLMVSLFPFLFLLPSFFLLLSFLLYPFPPPLLLCTCKWLQPAFLAILCIWIFFLFPISLLFLFIISAFLLLLLS